MAIVYKTLGQVVPVAINTDIDLYTVPAATSAVCSTLVVCNRASGASYRVAIRPAGAVIEPKNYIIYDSSLSANNTSFLTIGLTLAESDVVTVSSSVTTVSFSLFGSEIA